MSRIQRRGRVGRIANGTVFYMYSKNSRSEIKSPLDIYNSNISNVCFSMMRKSHEEEYFIEPNYDILNFKILDDSFNSSIVGSNITKYLNISIYDKITNKDIYSKEKYDPDQFINIYELLTYHHTFNTLDKSSFNLLYVGDPKLSENIEILKNSLHRIHYRFYTGYNMTTLLDFAGTFYIVHPSEPLLKRHIVVGLVDKSSDKKYIENVYSNIEVLYLSDMIQINKNLKHMRKELLNIDIADDLESSYIENNTFYIKKINKNIIDITSIKKTKLIKEMTSDRTIIFMDVEDTTNDVFDKSEYAEKFMRIYEDLDISDIDFKDDNLKKACINALLYGYKMNLEKEVCKTVAAILAFTPELKSLIPKNSENRFDLTKNPLHQFINPYGDIIVLYNIFNKLEKDLIYLRNIWNPYDEIVNKNIETDFKKSKKQYLEQKTKYMNEGKLSILKDDYKVFKTFQQIDQQGILNNNRGLEKYKKMSKDKLKKQDISKDDYEQIIKWSLIRGLPYKNIHSMISIYINLMSKFKIAKEKIDKVKENINITKEKFIEENIIKCFLFGLKYNIGLFNATDNKIYHLLNDVYVFNLRPIYPKSNVLETTINPNKYVFYLTRDNDDAININNIELKWLIEILPDFINVANVKDIIDFNQTSKLLPYWNDIMHNT